MVLRCFVCVNIVKNHRRNLVSYLRTSVSSADLFRIFFIRRFRRWSQMKDYEHFVEVPPSHLPIEISEEPEKYILAKNAKNATSFQTNRFIQSNSSAFGISPYTIFDSHLKSRLHLPFVRCVLCDFCEKLFFIPSPVNRSGRTCEPRGSSPRNSPAGYPP